MDFEDGVRRVIDDPSARVTVPMKVINPFLTCPVCLGILRETVIVMECAHRFCSDCIQKCLRVHRKECPSCRTHVPSRRSLRRDHAFDRLIRMFYPDLQEYEAAEDAAISAENRSRFDSSFSEPVVAGMNSQMQRRRRGQKNVKRDESGPSQKRRRTDEGVVSFVLARAPDDEEAPVLVKSHLRTSELITVGHLKKFLSKKFEYFEPSAFQISVVNSGSASVTLSDGDTVRSVTLEHSPEGLGEVCLMYRLDRKSA